MIEYGKLSYKELEDYSNMQAAQIRKKNNQIEQLQARVKELEDMIEDYREKVRSWVSKTLHENAEKHRLEAEIAYLRRHAEEVRIAISERTNRLQALRQV